MNPQGAKHRRILSTQAGSDRFGKFSTLFDFSTGYKATVLIRSDPKCSVLSMELLQFYYSPSRLRAALTNIPLPLECCPTQCKMSDCDPESALANEPCQIPLN